MARPGKTKFQRELKHVKDISKFEKEYSTVLSLLMSMKFSLRFRFAMRLIFKGKRVKETAANGK